MSGPRPAGASCAAWPLERALFAIAGSVILISVALALLVSPWFLVLTALVGLNQLVYVALGACPASLLLERVTNMRSVVYPKEAKG